MVHNYYQIGGGEHTVFKNEVELLKDYGNEVIEYTRSNDELKKSKIKLLLSPLSTLWSVKTYRDVRRIIKDKQIELVHCHNTFPLISPSVYYAANRQQVPVVQTIHNFRFLCPNGTFFCGGHICELCREKNSFKDALRNKCYRDSRIQTFIVAAMLKLHRAAGTYRKINYIFLTEFNKEKFKDLIDISAENVFVKPNFVKEERTGQHHQTHKVFVFAGRLEENKGITLLLERWKRIPSEYQLHIYGNGSLNGLVSEAADSRENISFYGFKPQEEILEDLESACALIFPSVWYEGFPMAISESFSVGCPVVSADIGNQAALIKASGGGELFDLYDEESFVEAIEHVIKKREELSELAYDYYRNNLTSEGNYKRLIEIYVQLLKE